MNLNVLFLDNHIIVVEKPTKIPTQSAKGHRESLEDFVKQFLKIKFAKPGNVFAEAVHRLDKDVSGIVVFARTSKALSRLQQQIRDQAWKKVYLAKVCGVPKDCEKTLEHYLEKKAFYTECFSKASSFRKRAILSYKVLSKSEESSLLEVNLYTGRYHQIRAQLSFIGHPIMGDSKYGSKQDLDHIKLIHKKLSFSHPVTKETLHFVSEQAVEL